NLPVTAYVDVLMQRMVASSCHTGDVVVVISWTGRTRELVDIARLARESGAVVLGITAPGSPLATECTETLEVATPEDTDHYMPMTSRMIQLALIDVLATGVTLRRGEDFLVHLKKIKDSLLETRYPALARK
ncbi:MAG: SIS domain-containing protein, partial [Halomonas sp.]